MLKNIKADIPEKKFYIRLNLQIQFSFEIYGAISELIR